MNKNLPPDSEVREAIAKILVSSPQPTYTMFAPALPTLFIQYYYYSSSMSALMSGHERCLWLNSVTVLIYNPILSSVTTLWRQATHSLDDLTYERVYMLLEANFVTDLSGKSQQIKRQLEILLFNVSGCDYTSRNECMMAYSAL